MPINYLFTADSIRLPNHLCRTQRRRRDLGNKHRCCGPGVSQTAGSWRDVCSLSRLEPLGGYQPEEDELAHLLVTRHTTPVSGWTPSARGWWTAPQRRTPGQLAAREAGRSTREGHLGPWVLMAKARRGSLRAGGLPTLLQLPKTWATAPSELCASPLGPVCPWVHTTLQGPGVWLGGSAFSRSAASPPGTDAHTHVHAHTQVPTLARPCPRGLQPQGHRTVTLSTGCLVPTCGCG